MAAPSQFRRCLGFELPQLLTAELLLQLWPPMHQCVAAANGTGVFTCLRPGHVMGGGAFSGNKSDTSVLSVHPPQPALGESQCSSLLTSRVWLPSALQPATGLIFPLVDPTVGRPRCGLKFSPPREGADLCNLPFLLGPVPRAQVPTQLFLSFLADTLGQPWLCRSLSASLQFVFSERCCRCSCIFYVFLVGCVPWWGAVFSMCSWFLSPPLCRLDLQTQYSIWNAAPARFVGTEVGQHTRCLPVSI